MMNPVLKNALTVYTDGRVVAPTSIETPTLIVDKLVNRTTTNISFSGAFLPDTGADLVYQTIGNITTPWNEIYVRKLRTDGLWTNGLGVEATGP